MRRKRLVTRQRIKTADDWIDRCGTAQRGCRQFDCCGGRFPTKWEVDQAKCEAYQAACPGVDALDGITQPEFWDVVYRLGFKVVSTPEDKHRGEHAVEYFDAETARDKATGRYGN